MEDIREDRTDNEIDFVAFDQRIYFSNSNVRFEFIVLHHQLNLFATHLAAQLLKSEINSVTNLLPNSGGGA
ncbi:hypothetical protein D9M72_467770 [compost metagenome]